MMEKEGSGWQVKGEDEKNDGTKERRIKETCKKRERGVFMMGMRKGKGRIE